jgi:hypothetical protein
MRGYSRSAGDIYRGEPFSSVQGNADVVLMRLQL